MEINNWRNEETRQKIVNKITDTLQRHMPLQHTDADGMNELKKIALRFEEKTYTVAINQQDYLRRISLKMLSLESKASGPSNHFHGSSPGNNQRPLDLGDMMLRPQIRNQQQAPGNSLPLTGQPQPQQPMLQQNLQISISAGGMPTSAGLAPSLSSIPNGLLPMQGMPHNSINISTSQVLPPLQMQLQSRQQQHQQHQFFQHQLQQQQQALLNKKLQQQSQLQPSILQLQQSALPQSQLQPSQQAMLQAVQQPALQSTQQSILQQSQPSILQPAQQSVLQSTQQSSVQQASQTPLQQHQQSMLKEKQSQQSVIQQQQQSSMVHQAILQPQQQHQHQHQQLLGQQNMQQQQQQHQIHQLLQSKHQQTQQTSSSLLQSQSQQLQQQSQQQQLLSQLQSQTQPLQQQQRLLQQPNPIQQELQRLQKTGGLLQQQQQPSSIEQQKQLLQLRGLPEGSSTSMESLGDNLPTMASTLPLFSTSYIYRRRNSLNSSYGFCKTWKSLRFTKHKTKLTLSNYGRRDAILFTVFAEIVGAHQQQENLGQPAANAKEFSKESLERIQIDGEPPTIVLAPGRRIVAVGDMHGDLAKARHALEIAGVLSSDGHDYWTGGTTVLVQLGDILDRGEDEIAIMSLLRSLSLQAEINGGAVFQVNGNHETMNVEGDFRFADLGAFDEAEDFIEYTNEHKGDWHTAFIEWIKVCQRWKARRKRPATGSIPWDLIEMQKRAMARSSLFMPGGRLACELARHGVVLKVNDWIFCHGGLLPHHVNYGMKQMNNEVARWMRGDENKNGVLEQVPFIATRGYDSVVWSRLYSQETLDNGFESYEICGILEAVLDSVNAKGMVVGHTPQTAGANGKCNCKIWRIDVGMSSGVLNAIPEVLEIIGDQVKVIRADKQGMFREDMIDYFSI